MTINSVSDHLNAISSRLLVEPTPPLDNVSETLATLAEMVYELEAKLDFPHSR